MSTQLRWHDVRDWGVGGKGWEHTPEFYGRLPAHARRGVPAEVWELGRHSTGLYTDFITDSPEVHARWTLLSERLAMPHMPATSVSGIDLYARAEEGEWRWVAVGQPEVYPEVKLRLTYGLTREPRTFRIYLPLFNGVYDLSIGVVEGAEFCPVETKTEAAVVVYGTSIVHGIAASRPGMCHTSILSRCLDTPFVNLGFSGRGKMDYLFADLLSEIKAKAIVIDCLPNMEPHLVKERAEDFVTRLARLNPSVPIVLVEDRTYANAWAVKKLAERNSLSRAILRDVYRRVVEGGLKHISYVAGDRLLGDDGEATVDGTHPTDLGFVRLAEVLGNALSPLIN
ncbi:MAG TPA: SGNH/GDSL hydrolase family protein [Pyrinomonadaceae bacterium]